MKLGSLAAAFALVCAMTSGCDLLSKKDTSSTPTSPTTPTTTLDAFARTWTSITASSPPTGCGNLKYTVTPTTTTGQVVVNYTATVCGIPVSGTETVKK